MGRTAIRQRRYAILLAATVIALAAAFLARRLFAEDLDYLRTPAASSLESRWYSLAELKLTPNSALEALHVEVGSTTTNALDLRDKTCFPKLALLWERPTLTNTEKWEDGIGPKRDVVGYPSVVHNVHGPNADGRWYLFYAIHDPYSGIAQASSASVEGPWEKLGSHEGEPDSRVLRAPKRPRLTSHYSSPVVIWNEREQQWFMFFHFYNNEWATGKGHQRTALATSRDIRTHQWQPWADRDGKLIAVLPTTPDRWMNSQSTYHAIYVLPGGIWLAFLRGVGGEYQGSNWRQDPAALGLAVSNDGRRWAQMPANPWIHQRDGRGGRAGVYRPLFVTLLRDRFVFTWAESNYYDEDPAPVSGESSDLRALTPTSPDFGAWTPADGAVPTIRDGPSLYLFNGGHERAYSLLGGCNASSPVEAAAK